MTKHDLQKAYDFRSTESRIYAMWETGGYFKPHNDPNKPDFDPNVEPFVISIPPPNVTGELHLRHAMFVSVEDLMIRYHRMKGYSTLWVPGTDHAGIATPVSRLSDAFVPEFDFGQEEKTAEGATAEVDFSGKEPVGQCPKCHARVFENGMYYLCEQSVGPAKSCDFRSGAIILQQPIERAQMAKLLAGGRTDLLTRFVSKRKGRTFKALLVLKEGDVEFEFEARPPRAGPDGKAGRPKEPKPNSTSRARPLWASAPVAGETCTKRKPITCARSPRPKRRPAGSKSAKPSCTARSPGNRRPRFIAVKGAR